MTGRSFRVREGASIIGWRSKPPICGASNPMLSACSFGAIRGHEPSLRSLAESVRTNEQASAMA
jgi:hypothetical protein